MAPREVKTTPEFPDTLPEDFAEWDGGEQQPGPAPVQQAPVQSTRPVDVRPQVPTRVVVPERETPTYQPVVRAPKAAPPAPAKVAPAAPPKAAPKPEPEQWQPPRPKQASAPAKPEYSPASQRNAEAKLADALWPEGEQKKKAKSDDEGESKSKMLPIIIGVVVCIGLGGGGYMFYSSRSHTQSHPQQTVSETTVTNPTEPLAGTPDGKPDPRNATNGANPSNAKPTPAQQANQNSSQTAAQNTTADNTADNTPPQPAPQVSMNQFNAQSQIPRGQQQLTAPEPSGNLNMGGTAAAPMIGTSSNQRVTFNAAKPIDVSSAALQLTRRTTPDYPEIARNSHVSGVVSVAITITPQGTVADARATNGPALLRQPAVNAVRNWRFKPYMLNGHPVAVTSNVNVNFAIQ